MSIRNNTVGTTEITPVEMEVTKSMKQESRDFSRGRICPFTSFRLNSLLQALIVAVF